MKMAKVGVKKRRAPATLAIDAAETSPKRSKVNNTSQDLNFSPSLFIDQLKSIGNDATDILVKPDMLPAAAEECCSSDESPSSCCSTNGSSGLEEESAKFSDHKVQVHSAQVETSTSSCGDQIRSEMRTNSQEVESMEKTTTQENFRCVVKTQRKMPAELELEEFFATAEKDIQKRFSDKYNFDIVKDVPLEGRYEWVQLQP